MLKSRLPPAAPVPTVLSATVGGSVVLLSFAVMAVYKSARGCLLVVSLALACRARSHIVVLLRKHRDRPIFETAGAAPGGEERSDTSGFGSTSGRP